jgi:peptide methionine sulfoxide reductase MsrB
MVGTGQPLYSSQPSAGSRPGWPTSRTTCKPHTCAISIDGSFGACVMSDISIVVYFCSALLKADVLAVCGRGRRWRGMRIHIPEE